MRNFNIFIIILLSCSFSYARNIYDQKEILKCDSTYENLTAQFISYNNKGILKIKDSDGKEYICENNAIEFFDNTASVRFYFRVIFDSSKGCIPKIPRRLSKFLRTEVTFDYELTTHKTFLDWAKYSAPKECYMQVNNLEDYFSRIRAKK